MPELTGTLIPPRQSAPPTSPVSGQLYYDTDDNKLYYWDGTTWISAAGSGGGGTYDYFEQATDPGAAASVGDIWVENDVVVSGALIPPPQLVSVLPTSPVDGQEIYYVADAANGILWNLRYRVAASGSYKWEFVGGSRLIDEILPQQSTASATYVDLATVGPQVTVPLAGDYSVNFGALITTVPPNPWVGLAAIKRGAAATSDNDAILFFGGPITGAPTLGGQGSREMRMNALAASTVLKMQYRSNSISTNFERRWLSVEPVRVG